MLCFQGIMRGAIGWLRRVGTRRLWADENFREKRQPRSLQTRRSQSAISCCAFSRSKAPLPQIYDRSSGADPPRELPPACEDIQNLGKRIANESTDIQFCVHRMTIGDKRDPCRVVFVQYDSSAC